MVGTYGEWLVNDGGNVLAVGEKKGLGVWWEGKP
jgi:hypothetical protein